MMVHASPFSSLTLLNTRPIIQDHWFKNTRHDTPTKVSINRIGRSRARELYSQDRPIRIQGKAMPISRHVKEIYTMITKTDISPLTILKYLFKGLRPSTPSSSYSLWPIRADRFEIHLNLPQLVPNLGSAAKSRVPIDTWISIRSYHYHPLHSTNDKTKMAGFQSNARLQEFTGSKCKCVKTPNQNCFP